MAIRVTSSTPQQQTTNPSAFGAIKSYTSPLDNLRVANPGRGLTQAAQAIGDLGQHIQRKKDEVNNTYAEEAVTNYGIAVQNATKKFDNALKTKDKDAIAKAQAEYDALSPESKDFSFNNYTDKPVDDKYYAKYLSRSRLNYNTNKLALDNYQIEMDLINIEDEKYENAKRDYFKLNSGPTMDPSALREWVESTSNAGFTISDNFTDPSVKPAKQAEYSKLIAEAYTNFFAQQGSEEELIAAKKQLYDDLATDDLGTYFDHEATVNNAFVKRLGELQANGDKEQVTNAKNNLNIALSNLESVFDVFDSKGTHKDYHEGLVEFLSKIPLEDPTNPYSLPKHIEGEDLEKYKSAVIVAGYLGDIPDYDPDGDGPLKPIPALKPVNQDIIEYYRTGELPDDLSPELTDSHKTKINSIVKEKGKKLRELVDRGDRAGAYELIFGDAATTASGVKIAPQDITKFYREVLGAKHRGVGINHPETQITAEWYTDPETTVKHMYEVFANTETSDVLNWVAVQLQSQGDDEISEQKLGMYDVLARGIVHADVDTNDPLQLSNFITDKITYLAELYNEGINTAKDSRIDSLYQQLRILDQQQPEQFRSEIFKTVYDDPAVRNQAGLQKFYNNILKGYVGRIYDQKEKFTGFFDLISDNEAFYNQLIEAEGELFSSVIGNTAKSSNGTRVLIPTGLHDQLSAGGKKIRPYKLQVIERFAIQVEAFKNMFRKPYGSALLAQENPKYLNNEIADAIERGAVFFLSQLEPAYRDESIDYENLPEDSPLRRFKIQEKVLREYQRGELSQKEVFIGLLNSGKLKLDRPGTTADGRAGITVEYQTDPITLDTRTYILPDGNDLVISYDDLYRLAGIDLDTRVSAFSMKDTNTGTVMVDPVSQLGMPRITDEIYFDKALEASK